MKIIKDLSPNFTTPQNSQAQYGKPRTYDYIVLHWWGDPKASSTLQSTVDYLKNPKNKVSAHYVISLSKVVQLVEEQNIAWHAMSANPQSIGIEIDPRFQNETMETVYKLVADISKRHNIPLDTKHILPHKHFVATACPGTLDINKVVQGAKKYLEDSFTMEMDIPSAIEEKYKLKDYKWYSKYWTFHQFFIDAIKTYQERNELKEENKSLLAINVENAKIVQQWSDKAQELGADLDTSRQLLGIKSSELDLALTNNLALQNANIILEENATIKDIEMQKLQKKVSSLQAKKSLKDYPKLELLLAFIGIYE